VARDVSASYDTLTEALETMCSFLQRLDIYTKIPPTTSMAETLVKILVQFLFLLAAETKQVKQGRPSKSNLSGTPHHSKKIQGNS
jgi:hypothetical protein